MLIVLWCLNNVLAYANSAVVFQQYVLAYADGATPAAYVLAYTDSAVANHGNLRNHRDCLFVVLRHSNSISVIPWRTYDV